MLAAWSLTGLLFSFSSLHWCLRFFFSFFTIEEILEAIRIRKGEILEDKSSTADETEKASIENRDSTDADNSKEELSKQQLDVNKDVPAEESSKKGRKEGKDKESSQFICCRAIHSMHLSVLHLNVLIFCNLGRLFLVAKSSIVLQ